MNMTPTHGQCGSGIDVGLSAVPETMLWTLHNRALVANDPTKEWFRDDKTIEIYNAIDYDYEKSFGKANDSHGLRSWLFDGAVRDFWKKNPNGGTVVNFAEGLETQRFRVENSRPEGSLMISIDLPSAIKAREKFIKPDETHLHIAASILDFEEWIPLVPKDKPILFTAQGLLMYLEEEDIRRLFQTLAKEFPNSHLWFDGIASWLSNLTTRPKGWQLTKDYKAPCMPFGVNINIAPVLFQSWVPGLQVEEVLWPFELADNWFFYLYVVPFLKCMPVIKNLQPGMVFDITFPSFSLN